MALEKGFKDFLDKKVEEYNRPFFIETDPVSVPHRFSAKPDIEIAGFFAAIFAWGNRTTIIQKSLELMKLMDHAPHDFCLHHSDQDLKNLLHFKHRTFNPTDLLYCVHRLKRHFGEYDSLETAFSQWMKPGDNNVENALAGFHSYFFDEHDSPLRTRKHIATPAKNSSCKRLNMYLRWMVRRDDAGVDFGLWRHISPAQLVCPLDVHVMRVAQRFKLLDRHQPNWASAVALTNALKQLDGQDPVKYDFALFGLGVMEKYQ